MNRCLRGTWPSEFRFAQSLDGEYLFAISTKHNQDWVSEVATEQNKLLIRTETGRTCTSALSLDLKTRLKHLELGPFSKRCPLKANAELPTGRTVNL